MRVSTLCPDRVKRAAPRSRAGRGAGLTQSPGCPSGPSMAAPTAEPQCQGKGTAVVRPSRPNTQPSPPPLEEEVRQREAQRLEWGWGRAVWGSGHRVPAGQRRPSRKLPGKIRPSPSPTARFQRPWALAAAPELGGRGGVSPTQGCPGLWRSHLKPGAHWPPAHPLRCPGVLQLETSKDFLAGHSKAPPIHPGGRGLRGAPTPKGASRAWSAAPLTLGPRPRAAWDLHTCWPTPGLQVTPIPAESGCAPHCGQTNLRCSHPKFLP